MYIGSRGLYNLKPPTVFVPPCIKDDVEKLLDVHKTLGQVELNCELVALDVGMYHLSFFGGQGLSFRKWFVHFHFRGDIWTTEWPCCSTIQNTTCYTKPGIDIWTYLLVQKHFQTKFMAQISGFGLQLCFHL